VAPAEPDVPTFDVKEVGHEKPGWKLSLPPHRLRLDRADGSPPFDVWRDQFPQAVRLLKRFRVLSVKLPLDGHKPKSVLLQLDDPTFRAVDYFIGPPTSEHLRLELKNRFSFAVMIGVGFVILAFLPTRDSPWVGAGHARFDPYLLGIGAVLVIAGALSKLVPHRIFFLVDAALFALFAVRSVERILHGGSWTWWLYMLVTAWLAFSNLQQFRRFANMRPAPDSPTAPSPPPPVV
jgi:hypothetical protein